MLSYLCHAVTWSTSTSGARLVISGYQSENILIETICINLWTLLLSLCASSRQSWIVLLSLSCQQWSLLELSFQLNFLTTTAPLILIIVSQMIFNFSLIQLMRDTNKANIWILKIREWEYIENEIWDIDLGNWQREYKILIFSLSGCFHFVVSP